MKSKFLTFFQVVWLRIYFVFFSTCLFILHPIQGQDRGVELKQAFIKAETDSLKFKAFESLYMHFIVRDLDETKSLLSTMDSLCSKIEIEDCRALENLFRGYYHRMSSNYDSSLYYLNASYKLYETLGNESKMGVCVFNEGVVTSYKGDYDGAAEKYIQARDLYKKVGNINGAVNVSNSLGIIYKNIKDYDRSKQSYQEGLDLAISSNNTSMKAMIYNNIANLFHSQAIYPDSIIYYANQSLDLEIDLKRNTGIASAHNLISVAYLDKKDKANAIHHANEALKYSRLSNSKRFIVIHEIALAEINEKYGNNNVAKQHYESALSLADSIGLLNFQSQGYRGYSDLLAKMGDHEGAYKARLKYEIHKDSIDIEDSKVAIADLEAKYENVLKDQEIKNQEIEISKRTYQRNLLFIGLGLSLLFGASLVWGLISRIRRNQKISRQNIEIKEQKINNLEQEKKFLSLSALLEGQESERIRIAKDLHDGLGGLLTAVKAHIGKIQSEIKKVKAMDIYHSATNMIDKAHEEVRRISHNLMPGELRVGGLIVGIEKLIKEMNDVYEIETTLETIGDVELKLDEKKELSIYRIVQELLNNIVKYAESPSAFIQISRFENEIQLLVEDAGRGFDYERALQSKGFGLKSIQSRVDQLGGSLDIDSRQDKGTQVTINIPF